MRRYEYGDPAKVLERRGEDCTNCAYLGVWGFFGTRINACSNTDATEQQRAQAPAKRCDQWRHIKADGGQ